MRTFFQAGDAERSGLLSQGLLRHYDMSTPSILPGPHEKSRLAPYSHQVLLLSTIPIIRNHCSIVSWFSTAPGHTSLIPLLSFADVPIFSIMSRRSPMILNATKSGFGTDPLTSMGSSGLEAAR